MTTEAAKHFVNENTLGQPLYDDDDEWNMWNNRGDPVLHIGWFVSPLTKESSFRTHCEIEREKEG